MMNQLTESESRQVEEILTRRANEIAGFLSEYRSDSKHYGSVELALTREVDRLRRLAAKIAPDKIGVEDD